MEKLSKLVLLLTFAILALGQTYTSTATCVTYNQTNGPQYATLNGSSIYIYMAPCPSGQVIGPASSTTSATCVIPQADGTACSVSTQCLNGACVNLKCTSPATSGTCVSSYDAADGYLCNSNNVIIAQVPKGGACTGTFPLECYHGACNMNTKLCDTFANALATQNTSSVIGGDSTGFKSCTIATVNTDCSYQFPNGTIKSANALGFSCMPTMYSPTVQYYCQMGGGESVFYTLAKQVIFCDNFIV